MVGPFFDPRLRIWLFSGGNLAPLQKVDLATLQRSYYSTRTLITRYCSLQCVTVIHKLISAPS